MRQFISDSELDSSGCLSVSGKKYRHMVQVLRADIGDMIFVRLPGGEIQQMTVAKINQAEKTLLLQCAGDSCIRHSTTEAPPAASKPEIELWLFQFVAKPPKMDLILRQATECGAAVIVPVAGEYCQSGSVESAAKKSDGNDNRWQRIITEAREQSGSPTETKILQCVTLDRAIEIWNRESENFNTKAVVLYEQTDGTVTIHKALADNKEIQKVAVFVGAEGGISPNEISALQNSGIIPVHLMTNILRCETAAIYGLATVQNTLMEKELWLFRE